MRNKPPDIPMCHAAVFSPFPRPRPPFFIFIVCVLEREIFIFLVFTFYFIFRKCQLFLGGSSMMHRPAQIVLKCYLLLFINLFIFSSKITVDTLIFDQIFFFFFSLNSTPANLQNNQEQNQVLLVTLSEAKPMIYSFFFFFLSIWFLKCIRS